VVSPLYGKLSDIHGRRATMLVAIGLFVAGSAVSAAAPSMAWLIAGRTLQGIGGGGIVPLSQGQMTGLGLAILVPTLALSWLLVRRRES